MNSTQRKLRPILTTWPFLISLATLLLNDAWLKGAYPGLITGKLSDFAGIAVVGLLVLAYDAQRPIRIMALLSLTFAWWKSPYSQGFIDIVNAYSPMLIGRVVDYTDLLAVTVLPVVASVTRHPAAFQIPGETLRHMLVVPVSVLTMLGLMATSMLQTRQDFQVRQPDSNSHLSRDDIAKTLAQVAEKHGLKCHDCAAPLIQARYEGNGMTLEYRFVGNNSIAFNVNALPNGIIFGTSGKEKADRLRANIKGALSLLHKGLEYVERLEAPARVDTSIPSE